MRDKGRARGIFKVYLQQPLFLSVLLIVLTAVVAAVSIKAGIIVSVSAIVYTGTALWLYSSRRGGMLTGLIAFSSARDQNRQNLLEEILMSYAVADDSGHLLWMNRGFTAILEEDRSPYKGITTMFPEITKRILATDGEVVSLHSCLGDRKFRVGLKQVVMDSLDAAVAVGGLEGQGSPVTAVYLLDKTQTLKYIQQINDQRLVVGLIYLDNYDETLESMEEVRHPLLTALIDRKINKYISDMNDIIKRIEKDKYFFTIRQQYMARIQGERFPVLEGVKTVSIGNNMAVTLGIDTSMSGDSYNQSCEYVRTSMDMALGRGDDQAVVKNSDKIQYYGGKAQQMEKTTGVKAGAKARTLRELMENKDRLLIMRHRLTDIDSFGATVGIYRITMSMNKKASIVVNEVASPVHPMMEQFTENVRYPEDILLTRLKAAELVNQGIILVIVDVNRPSITDKPALLEMVKTIVVLDHHRTSSEIIDNAILSYVELYTSSTCEMVAEVLQYIADGTKIRSAEVGAMYTGIIIDTQNFTNQTGVRTFKVAAFLRRSGAGITRVHKLFRESMKDYQTEADAVRKIEVFMGALVISGCPVEGLESPTIIGTQTANELLEIHGMKASVVLIDCSGTIYFSVRSIDEVNVQVMMEKLGGGGHRTIASAQIRGVTVKEAKEQLRDVIHQMTEEDEVS